MATPSAIIRSPLAGPGRITRSISNLLSPAPLSPRPTKTELQTKLAPAHIRAWVRSQRAYARHSLGLPVGSPLMRPGVPIGLGIQLSDAEYPAPFTSSSPCPPTHLLTTHSGRAPSPIAAFCLTFPELLPSPVPRHEPLNPNVPLVPATLGSGRGLGLTLSSPEDEVYVPPPPGAPRGDFRRTPGAPARVIPKTPGAPALGCLPTPEGVSYYRLPSGILTPAERGLGLGSNEQLGLDIHPDILPDYFSGNSCSH